MARDRESPVEILRRILAAKTDKQKAKIVREVWNSTREDFFVGLQMSFDPNIVFGLDKVVEIKDEDDGDPGTFTFNDFIDLTNQLTNDNVDLTTKKDLVRKAAMEANITEWNFWYREILLKTLHKKLPMDVIVTTLQELTKR